MSFIRRSIPALVFLSLSAVFAAFVGVVLFGNSIRDWSNEVRFSILRLAGIGAFPIGVLVVALLLTLIFRREWLKKYNYWLSSALFVLAISGVLSFFRPFDGWLAWFKPLRHFHAGRRGRRHGDRQPFFLWRRSSGHRCIGGCGNCFAGMVEGGFYGDRCWCGLLVCDHLHGIEVSALQRRPSQG